CGVIGAAPVCARVMPPVSLENPPPSVRGMRHLRLDMKGRLIEVRALPQASDATAGARAMDWNLLFTAAGLNRQAFQPVTPSWTSPVASDDQAAWNGVFAEEPDVS